MDIRLKPVNDYVFELQNKIYELEKENKQLKNRIQELSLYLKIVEG